MLHNMGSRASELEAQQRFRLLESKQAYRDHPHQNHLFPRHSNAYQGATATLLFPASVAPAPHGRTAQTILSITSTPHSFQGNREKKTKPATTLWPPPLTGLTRTNPGQPTGPARKPLAGSSQLPENITLLHCSTSVHLEEDTGGTGANKKVFAPCFTCPKHVV